MTDSICRFFLMIKLEVNMYEIQVTSLPHEFFYLLKINYLTNKKTVFYIL